MKLEYFLILIMMISTCISRVNHKKKIVKKINNKKVVSHFHSGVHSHLIINNTPYSYYHLSANNYINMARLAYCPKKLILAKRCKICHFALNKHKIFFIHSVNQKRKKIFQFIILYSDVKKEIVISFSGPGTNNAKIFNTVYQKGFVSVSELGLNIHIENYYWEIYSKYIRKVLTEKVQKLIKSKRNLYKFIFIGHSFGGSIATLAAFDLTKNNIIKKNKKIDSPIVYTYGQLRIGDNAFVTAANKLIKLIRIMRSDDFVTRVPSCAYDNSSRLFKCYNKTSSTISHFPKFKKYFLVYRKGIRIYRKTIIKKYKITDKKHDHYHSYYSQPLGTVIYYKGNNFSNYKPCVFRNGIPLCEEKIKLPATFSASAHSRYFGVDVESC